MTETDALVALLLQQVQAAEAAAAHERNAHADLNRLVDRLQSSIQVRKNGRRAGGRAKAVYPSTDHPALRNPRTCTSSRGCPGRIQKHKMILRLRDATISDFQRKRPLAEIDSANRVRPRPCFHPCSMHVLTALLFASVFTGPPRRGD